MFKIYEVEDVARIPPSLFGIDLRKAAKEILEEKYLHLVNEELGYIIAIFDVEVDTKGKLILGDGATYHKVRFKAVSFYPSLQEVVEGDVVDIQEFGAFMRLGPIDAFIHVSQVADDYIVYDETQPAFICKKTRRVLRRGDVVRARVIAISLSSAAKSRVGLTMRQPFLGKLEWVLEDLRKLEEAKAGG
ncbi:MAG: DNA-directed RNA polymerase [Candidatus Bathyarchaeota archaeon]|nr:DNA-directed RNA polymerase [Candidatus Bathyarchaeota archaeon]